MPSRALVATAMTLAVVVAAVGCGRQADPVAVDVVLDGRAVAASAEKTAAASTAKVRLTVATEASGPTSGTSPAGSTGSSISLTMTGDGAYDRAAGLWSMTIDLGSSVDQLLSSLPDDLRDRMRTRLGGDLTQQVVQQGSTVYLRSGALGVVAPAMADRWVRIDLSRVGRQAGIDLLGGDGGLGTTGDPSAYLDQLKGVGAEVTTVGSEPVNGVDTTHLRAAVSVRQALEAAGVDRAELERSLAPGSGRSGAALEDTTLPVDVYVDGQGYLRRIRISYDGGLLERLGRTAIGSGSSKGTLPAGTGWTTTMTADYLDIGAPVTITVPSPDQTVDLCQLLASGPTGAKPGGTVPTGLC